MALCLHHHGQADLGAFTIDQLREFKSAVREDVPLRGQFQWRRERLILLVGGNWWTGCTTLVQCGVFPLIWLTRHRDGYELLNLDLFDDAGVPRLQMRDNDWIVDRDVDDLECPPKKANLTIRTQHLGAELRISFAPATSKIVTSHALRILRWGDQQLPERIRNYYTPPPPELRAAAIASSLLDGNDKESSALCRIEGRLTWPVSVTLDRAAVRLPGNNMLSGCMATNCRVGLQFS